jgi:amylosucrase
MSDTPWLQQQTQLTLERLRPRLQARLAAQVAADPGGWQDFSRRLDANFPHLFETYHGLYAARYDFFYHLEELLVAVALSWFDRPAALRSLDAAREADPHWFKSERMLGGVCYVDLFAGNLEGVRAQIPYFKELGLTYLHLMPLFASPAGNNDGGYAVSSYRDVNPSLGAMAQLSALAAELRANGISLVLDFVFNHTSDEHEWARRAQAGDPVYEEFYYVFPDRTMPDAYDKNLREIFPDVRPGSFTYRPDMKRWVWTTFNSFQWDLNYSNPSVFRAMAGEMLFLANAGIEVLRLDAVAFVWKQLGTSCENLPQAHLLIQAYNALARMAAPALLFKSEAIVHPDDVVKYIGPGECQLSYNPLLMALLWEALATREVKLLQGSLRDRFRINPACAWVNYIRCHDDIGWTFDDADAARVNIHGFDHRRFLNAFYTGRFTGSFAAGLPFQENPKTGDCRISGTAASLAGLERALFDNDPPQIELALRRILLLHSIILSMGGVPLLYLGDEIGMLNDYGYVRDPAKAGDSRWVHRPFTNQVQMESRHDPATLAGRLFTRLLRLIALRRASPALGAGETTIFDTGNGHVLGYVRQHGGQRLLLLANFSEGKQVVANSVVRIQGLAYHFHDLVADEQITLSGDLELGPFRFLWLAAK